MAEAILHMTLFSPRKIDSKIAKFLSRVIIDTMGSDFFARVPL
jgi:hypothetical protein